MSSGSEKQQTRLDITEDNLLTVLSQAQDQANFLATFNNRLTGTTGAEPADKSDEEPSGKLNRIDTIISHIRNEQGRIAHEIERLKEIA